MNAAHKFLSNFVNSTGVVLKTLIENFSEHNNKLSSHETLMDEKELSSLRELLGGVEKHLACRTIKVPTVLGRDPHRNHQANSSHLVLATYKS